MWTYHRTHTEVKGKPQVTLPSTSALHGTGGFELILPTCVASALHTKPSSIPYLTTIFENPRIREEREGRKKRRGAEGEEKPGSWPAYSVKLGKKEAEKRGERRAGSPV